MIWSSPCKNHQGLILFFDPVKDGVIFFRKQFYRYRFLYTLIFFIFRFLLIFFSKIVRFSGFLIFLKFHWFLLNFWFFNYFSLLIFSLNLFEKFCSIFVDFFLFNFFRRIFLKWQIWRFFCQRFFGLFVSFSGKYLLYGVCHILYDFISYALCIKICWQSLD